MRNRTTWYLSETYSWTNSQYRWGDLVHLITRQKDPVNLIRAGLVVCYTSKSSQATLVRLFTFNNLHSLKLYFQVSIYSVSLGRLPYTRQPRRTKRLIIYSTRDLCLRAASLSSTLSRRFFILCWCPRDLLIKSADKSYSGGNRLT